MNTRYVSILVDNPQGTFHEKIRHETPHKLEAADNLKPKLDDVLAERMEWSEFIRQGRKYMSHHLGWRAVDDLAALVTDHPEALRTSVEALLESKNPTTFFDRLRAAGVDIRKEGYKNIQGPGAQASVASFFLFLDDPAQFPVYRARNVGTPLAKVVQEKINSGSPDEILERYYLKLTEVESALRKEGVPVRHRLDVQGVLFIADYKKWFEEEAD